MLRRDGSLKKKKKPELLDIAQSLGLKLDSKLKKNEIVKALIAEEKTRQEKGKPFLTLVERNEEELSFDLEETQLTLLPQNARVGYTFWELSSESKKQIKNEFAQKDGKRRN